MASSFETDFAAAYGDQAKDVFGVAVTLKGPLQNDLSATAVEFGGIQGQSADDEFGEKAERKAEITLATDDITDAKAWDSVVIDGTEWRIEHPPLLEKDGFTTFLLVRVGVEQIGRTNE